jgi:hypothetical protein
MEAMIAMLYGPEMLDEICRNICQPTQRQPSGHPIGQAPYAGWQDAISPRLATVSTGYSGHQPSYEWTAPQPSMPIDQRT